MNDKQLNCPKCGGQLEITKSANKMFNRYKCIKCKKGWMSNNE